MIFDEQIRNFKIDDENFECICNVLYKIHYLTFGTTLDKIETIFKQNSHIIINTKNNRSDWALSISILILATGIDITLEDINKINDPWELKILKEFNQNLSDDVRLWLELQ